MNSIFISHASADDHFASIVEELLRKNGFDDLFVDHNSIVIGERWAQALKNASHSCRIVICLVTRNWLSSIDCYGEFMAAYYMGKRIVPLFHLPTEPTKREAVVLQRVRAEHQGYDLGAVNLAGTSRSTLPADLEKKLVAALRAGGAIGDVGLDPEAFAVDPISRLSPFPGLQSFEDTDADAAIFFGRSADIARCLEDIRQMRADGAKRIYALVGASGSGKSSLLKAGVLPRLRREKGWLALRAFSPANDPLLELCIGLVDMAAESDHGVSPGAARDVLAGAWYEAKGNSKLSLEEFSRLLAKAFANLMGRLRIFGGEDAVLLVTIDQAEELLRLQSEANTMLCDYVQALVLHADEESRDGRTLPKQYLVAMTLRSDSLDEFQSSPLFASLQLKVADIRPVPAHRIARTIEGPAARYGVRIAPELLDTILANIPEKDQLPLVAFMLERMWRLYRKGDELPSSAFQAVGGLEGLLAGAAERALAGLDPDDERQPPRLLDQTLDAAASRVFVPPLAQVDNLGTTVRRVAHWSEFGQEARGLLERFVAWHLIVIRPLSGDGDRGSTVEVAHEALFRCWPRLADWIGREKRLLQELRDLQDAAQDWEREGRRREYGIHQGPRLRSALRLIEIPHFKAQLLERDSDYVAACLRRRRSARIRNVGLGVAATLVLLVTSLGFDSWFTQDKMSIIATRLIGNGYPARAAKFAVAGAFDRTDLLGRLGGTSRAIALAETGYAFRIALSLPRDFSVSDFRLLRDGTRLVVQSSDHAGGVWDLDEQRLIVGFKEEGSLKHFYLPDDESFLVTRGADDSIMVWDPGSGNLLLRAPAKTLNSGNWSAALKRMISLSEEGTCILWNLDTGEQIANLGDINGIEDHTIFGTTTGGRVATRSARGRVDIWDAYDGHHIATLAAEKVVTQSSAISKQFRLLVGTSSGQVFLYDALSGDSLGELPISGRMLAWGFSSTGERFITRSVGNQVSLWDAIDARLVKELGNYPGANWRFSPDGRFVLTRTTEGGAKVWSAQSGEILLDLKGPGLRTFDFSPRGDRLAITSYGGAAALWNVDPLFKGGMDERKLVDLAGKELPTSYADDATFSDDGRRLALKSDSSPGGLWAADKGVKVSGFQAKGEGGGKFSKDGSVYASSGSNNSGSLYRSQSGEKIGVLGGGGAVYNVALSANGNVVATQSTTDSLIVWRGTPDVGSDASGVEMRQAVCAKNYDYVGSFTRESLSAPGDPGHEVRSFVLGRPWNPCDWRGLGSWEGWKQMARYWLVRLELYPDYVCGEVEAFSGRLSRGSKCSAVVSDEGDDSTLHAKDMSRPAVSVGAGSRSPEKR